MVDILVVVPAGFEPGIDLTGIDVMSAADSAGAADWLAARPGSGAVVWSDGLPGEIAEALAQAIEPHRARVIEVQSERWDGFQHAALSAACAGVIAGFGLAGVQAAIDHLRSTGA